MARGHVGVPRRHKRKMGEREDTKEGKGENPPSPPLPASIGKWGGKQMKDQRYKTEARIFSPGSGHRGTGRRGRRPLREQPRGECAETADVKNQKRRQPETNAAPELRLLRKPLKMMARGHVGVPRRHKRKMGEREDTKEGKGENPPSPPLPASIGKWGGKQMKDQRYKTEARIFSPGSGHRGTGRRGRRPLREQPRGECAETADVKNQKRRQPETNAAPEPCLLRNALKMMVRSYVGAS